MNHTHIGAQPAQTAIETIAAPLPAPFPFAAITGQPQLTQALLLAAIDPAIGGVLIEGPRGTAKSTAARALAALLAPAPFITVPLGAALEHVTGTLDLQQALAGHQLRFAPGLLARAHGGVLYVDEINLLPDAVVDVLLDAAASGVNVVERDGISHAHAARFVLVGTMNPEEGELRPQLLDRLGLAVRLHNPADAAARLAIVRERLTFDADPAAHAARHASAQAALQAQVRRAQASVQDANALPLTDAVLQTASALCMAARVDGLRADLIMLRAARALAALQGSEAVTAQHVSEVAELVLAHRRHPDLPAPSPSHPAQTSPAPPAPDSCTPQTRTDPAAQNEAGNTPRGDEGDWGALPPEPVGIAALKPLRPLIDAAAKKT